jgi:phage-related protein
MADIRTLKLNLLADVDQFGRGMAQANSDTDTLQKGMSDKSKKMVKALTAVTIAVGAMAIALGVDAVKAAAEDEVSQAKFRESLKDSTGVTDAYVDSLDKVIEKMQFMSGFSDGELRDSLGRLARSTGNTQEAQDLLQIAMDTSRGTGKDLTTVADNLAKAYDGNEGALKRMGVPLDDNILKSGDFKDITDELTRLFGGQASEYADTYQGKLDIVNQRLGEFKEGAGKGLIDVLGTLLETVNDVAKGFSGEDPDGLSTRARELAGEFKGNGANSLGGSLKAVATAFEDLFTALNSSDAEGGTSALEKIAGALETFANALNLVTSAYEKAQGLGKAFSSSKIGGFVLRGENLVNTPFNQRAAGGSVMAGQPYRVGEFGSEIFVPSGSGSIRPDNGGGGNTFIFNGVIDGESARRSIERLLQDSARRTGAVSLVGATL